MVRHQVNAEASERPREGREGKRRAGDFELVEGRRVEDACGTQWPEEAICVGGQRAVERRSCMGGVEA
jgi:hypothetical protein